MPKPIYLGGVKPHPTGRVASNGGALTPSAKSALYPSGRATNPLVKSVGSIPAATPKAGRTPNALRTPPTR